LKVDWRATDAFGLEINGNLDTISDFYEGMPHFIP